jgi:hypothetical protein
MNRIRVQNHLTELIRSYDFPIVRYSNGLATYDESGFVCERPKSCVCNETAAQFEPDARHGLNVVLRRSTWIFDAIVRFDNEVLLEGFENQMMSDPPTLAKNSTTGDSQTTMYLLKTEAQHPTQESPQSGTLATFTFVAEVARL